MERYSTIRRGLVITALACIATGCASTRLPAYSTRPVFEPLTDGAMKMTVKAVQRSEAEEAANIWANRTCADKGLNPAFRSMDTKYVGKMADEKTRETVRQFGWAIPVGQVAGAAHAVTHYVPDYQTETVFVCK